ncbi:LytR cell envelope-related transcriptional attenuator [Jatrophihabitans endophyticus]|uniref:LytR cell envelope-related transcriptional attenuator n=1 Tax=Jatrophihabitans endophyticus TaxID=1206085 RepID=A0A1M5M5G9_9ACTN|nr:LytR C-terminal domain-containing protein [Jatrophihabitans endophyticus]SHG72505.1 LytR cell envelope-related transcriptional attenuator [Jatrophihabitans endophyticus]
MASRSSDEPTTRAAASGARGGAGGNGGGVVRRPLPALVALAALLLLTGIVWWRVVNRDDSAGADASSCPSPTATASASSSGRVTLPAPDTITLQVLNSTTRSGLAAKVRRTLQGVGFQVPDKAGNDRNGTKNKATAQIRFGPSGKRAATLVRYYFPGATLVGTSSKSATVVVAVGPKYRKVASSRAVAAALRSDDVAVAPRSTPPATTSPSATSSSVSC